MDIQNTDKPKLLILFAHFCKNWYDDDHNNVITPHHNHFTALFPGLPG